MHLYLKSLANGLSYAASHVGSMRSARSRTLSHVKTSPKKSLSYLSPRALSTVQQLIPSPQADALLSLSANTRRSSLLAIAAHHPRLAVRAEVILFDKQVFAAVRVVHPPRAGEKWDVVSAVVIWHARPPAILAPNQLANRARVEDSHFGYLSSAVGAVTWGSVVLTPMPSTTALSA